MIKIIPYQDSYSKFFFDLNPEWLEKYYYIEEHDREVLSNPKSYIIDNGGYIFFAKYNNEVVGTVALINNPEGFELSKMAVSPKYRGLKIGQKMMEYCIEFTKNKKWDKLILYSSRKLENAIYIYRKYNFIEVEIEENCPYERCDIKMVLKL
jgi:ribosomal protein S18 acetylase RimI-like enzyme